MNSISRPFVTRDDPDRDIRCQDALDSAFCELLARAMDAGWSEKESVEAIISLAEGRLLSVAANDDTDGLVAMLRQMLDRSA
ncbi:hypothetical protein [Rhizobium sp. BK376]|uniref:hypothetical protein n=1 Tax=Rhizobium sp. BK376 TaxID=2512149 RepID=UPI001050C87B|nr:hypothetical protein [Rhizobium sp. BK376]TCR76764.1 hypothetical protein EV561_11924 [Rhizobium sp. BK376]